MPADPQQPEIAIIGYDQCLASSISLALEMFNAAAEADAATRREQPFRPALLGAGQRIRCAGGLTLSPDGHPRSLAQPSLVMLAAIWRNPARVVKQQAGLLPLLRDWHRRGVKICAVGTSSRLLAEAGLLDQRAATTHWQDSERFARHYPSVRLQKNFLITRSDTIYCAGSVNSVADLVIFFIEEFYGKTIARKVEANFSPEIRQSYAKRMYTDGQHSRHTDEDIVRLQQWLTENYTNVASVSALASMLGISTRSLNRRFKAATEQSPGQYLLNLKLAQAEDLLRQTDLNINEVAEQSGFNDTSYFCARFRQRTTLSPSAFRRAGAAKIFSVD